MCINFLLLMRKNTSISRHAITIFLATLMCCLSIVVSNADELRGVNALELEKKAAPLTGDELLVNLVDREGQKRIVALSIVDGRVTSSILVSKGGDQSVWSPNRLKVAFRSNQNLYISDKSLNVVDFCPLDSVSYDESSPVCHWDNEGRAFIIGKSTAYGSYFARSVALEDLPISKIKSKQLQVAAFPEVIMFSVEAFKGKQEKYEVFSIKNASSSANSSLLAMQVFPASPDDLLVGESKVYIIRSVKYAIDQQQVTSIKEQLRLFVDAGSVVPNLAGPLREVLPKSEVAEIRPIFSPDGRNLCVDIVDVKNSIRYPTVIDIDTLSSSEPISDDKIEFDYFSPAWRGKNIIALDWIDNDRLLLISGSYQSLFIQKRVNGVWLREAVLRRVGSKGVRFDKVAHRHSLIAYTQTFDDQPAVHFYDVESKGEFEWNAPQGSYVSKLSW